MITIQTSCTVPLPCGVNDIRNFTINCGDFFFLDCSGCKIIKWCRCTQTIETIILDRKYLCFCYDHAENCYWGISECEPYRIYRLDACFCEVGHILIGAYQQNAIALCCDDCGNGVWVFCHCQQAFVEKCGGKVTWYKNEDHGKINLGVLMQCECRVNCFNEGSRQILEVLSPGGWESIELCVPKDHKVAGIASCYCAHKEGNCCFYVLLSKGCPREFVLTEYCINFSRNTEEPCCFCPPPCHPPCPPGPHYGGNYEVMHSIALEEAGLAHILNAEGEKIQKAVAISDNIEQLICVNESVKRTLTQVTLLEGMLYSKLEALVSCDDFCHDATPLCPPTDPLTPCYDCGDCRQSDAGI